MAMIQQTAQPLRRFDPNLIRRDRTGANLTHAVNLTSPKRRATLVPGLGSVQLVLLILLFATGALIVRAVIAEPSPTVDEQASASLSHQQPGQVVSASVVPLQPAAGVTGRAQNVVLRSLDPGLRSVQRSRVDRGQVARRTAKPIGSGPKQVAPANYARTMSPTTRASRSADAAINRTAAPIVSAGAQHNLSLLLARSIAGGTTIASRRWLLPAVSPVGD